MIIEERLIKFEGWMRRQHPLIFSGIFCFISFLVCMVFTLPFELGWVPDMEFYPTPLELEGHFGFKFLMAVILAPLFETLVFQYFIYWLMSRFQFFRDRDWLIILVSAFLFGSQHFYSVSYIFATCSIGLVLMYAYIIRRGSHPFWNVALTHALWNLTVLLVDSL